MLALINMPSFISDDFDQSHDLVTVRKRIKKMGARKDTVAEDNAFQMLEPEDWVYLNGL